jgi:hypothetical protein
MTKLDCGFQFEFCAQIGRLKFKLVYQQEREKKGKGRRENRTFSASGP